ncbi:hypothetical protein YH65_01705 [Sulfurovum lithotrophicum]|uniref:Uncharacterized protein n=1 Tax=Sulfurovum lithotrophicum TaxID=206403 RepID=A0A7U4RPX2_9BACT|nr:hypothetical protein [Sulfurovum lithotrophicum]AKF24253.1 hypothetical protein YH65_01705 [Sulfurovum lithotrophicum]
MKNFKTLVYIPLLLASLLTVASADDVVDTLNGVIKSYEKGEYGAAVEDLNYVLQLIQQKKSKGLEAYLPEALAGWSAEKAESQTAGSAMFGGGIATSRKYKKGSSRIKIEIITDSPLMQSMMSIFSNPMFATADGGKLERINREKAIVKYNDERQKGEITIVVARRFLVKIEGQKVLLDELRAYAKAIDFKKLKNLP